MKLFIQATVCVLVVSMLAACTTTCKVEPPQTAVSADKQLKAEAAANAPHDGNIGSIGGGGLSQRRKQNLRNCWAGRRSVLPFNAGLQLRKLTRAHRTSVGDFAIGASGIGPTPPRAAPVNSRRSDVNVAHADGASGFEELSVKG